MRKNRVIRAIVSTYIEIIRGTPFVVLLFIIYFGLPKLFLNAFGMDINGWNKAFYIIATLAIFGSARMSEAMRSAYLAVPKGQLEAAYSCGLSAGQAFLHVTMPQALLIALPNLGNLILSNKSAPNRWFGAPEVRYCKLFTPCGRPTRYESDS